MYSTYVCMCVDIRVRLFQDSNNEYMKLLDKNSVPNDNDKKT